MMMLMTINAQASGIEVMPTVNVADADFVAGKKAIETKGWNSAITYFAKVVERESLSADAHNYLGYAYR